MKQGSELGFRYSTCYNQSFLGNEMVAPGLMLFDFPGCVYLYFFTSLKNYCVGFYVMSHLKSFLKNMLSFICWFLHLTAVELGEFLLLMTQD